MRDHLARLRRTLDGRLDGVALLLAVALLVGVAIRLVGTSFCLPLEHCHPDEHYLYKPALHMLRGGDLNPHVFVYPTAFIYLLLAVYCATFLGGVSGGLWGSPGAVKIAPFILTGRLAAASLGAGTLLGVWAAGRRLLDRPSAAVAVLALALMPLHVADSHFVATDVPAGFFAALALAAAAKVADEGTRRDYLLAGLLVGFAAATKYNAGLIALNIPLAHYLNRRRERFFDANLLRGVGWIALGFLLACPYALLDLPHFLDGVATEMAHYMRAHVGHEGQWNRLFYFQFLAGSFGPVLTGLGVYGLWLLAARFQRRHLLLLVFPIVYMLFIGAYKVRFVRNLMPVLPYFALWIGHGAAHAFQQIRAGWPALRRVAAWKLALPALALAVAWPCYFALDETIALARTDTRLAARAWIERHVPRGSALLLQSWGVDALTPGKYRLSTNSFVWDYYVATDRLTRKYFEMEQVKREKYDEVREAFQHRTVALFPGRPENPDYCTASPTVIVLARDPQRPRVTAPPRPPPPPPPRPAPVLQPIRR